MEKNAIAISKQSLSLNGTMKTTFIVVNSNDLSTFYKQYTLLMHIPVEYFVYKKVHNQKVIPNVIHHMLTTEYLFAE